jgi:hypothetical protein
MQTISQDPLKSNLFAIHKKIIAPHQWTSLIL